MCPLHGREISSCDRDGDDTAVNTWIVRLKCFNFSCSLLVHVCTKFT